MSELLKTLKALAFAENRSFLLVDILRNQRQEIGNLRF